MGPQDGARNPWSAPTTKLWAPTPEYGCVVILGELASARRGLRVTGARDRVAPRGHDHGT